MLIHFLQRRDPPILPSLQVLGCHLWHRPCERCSAAGHRIQPERKGKIRQRRGLPVLHRSSKDRKGDGVLEGFARTEPGLVLQLDVPLEVEWAGLPILRFLVLRLSCRRKMWAPCSLSSSATLVMSTGMQICWLNFLSQTKHAKYTGAASSAFEILDQYCHQGMSFGPRLRCIHQWELVTDPDSHYYAIVKSVARNDFSCVPWICGMLWMITHITSYNIIITSHDII